MLNRLLCLTAFVALHLCALDVGSFGAVGNGIADDTNAIQRAINACQPGWTLYFQPGNYLVRTLYAANNCTFQGTGSVTLTLAAPNQFIVSISERSAVRLTGLRFDANNIGGAVIAQGFAPADQIRIDNCEFRNVSSTAVFPANLAVVSTWGLTNAVIQNNTFMNVAGGIWLTTIENVAILNNSFTNVTQSDAIYVAPNAVGFTSGDNLRIAGNTGSALSGAAIEIFRPDPPNGSILNAPLIENNNFSKWTQPGLFAFSITHGDGATIRNNRIDNTGGAMLAMGMELIVANAQVKNNVIAGQIANGIAVQGSAAPSILGNTITGMADNGILLACDFAHGRCASTGSNISNNLISNAHHTGIKLDNDWTNSIVSRNTITRTAGFWPDDNTVVFAGIHQSPAPGPGTIDSNWIIQDAQAWPDGFWFAGIRVNSSMPGSQITNNVVGSTASAPFGSGLIDNTGSATQGWQILNNSFLNLVN